MSMTGHVFTIADAAEACNVSKKTLNRKIKTGDLSNAFKDSKGRWKIPIEDLIQAGYKINEYKNETRTNSTTAQVKTEPKADKIKELEDRLQVAETRAKIAEAKLEYADKLIRVLEAPKTKKRWFRS